MKKLIEALHVIQNECVTHSCICNECPMGREAEEGAEYGHTCLLIRNVPYRWQINDAIQKALL